MRYGFTAGKCKAAIADLPTCCQILSSKNAKQMNKLSLFLILGSVLFLSCDEEYMVTQDERRIGGTWKLERAFLRTNSSNFPGFYEGDRMVFHDDHTVFLQNSTEGATFEGNWSIYMSDQDGHEDCPVSFLDFEFQDQNKYQTFSYTAEITFLSHRKMKFKVMTDDGEYKFKLLKQ